MGRYGFLHLQGYSNDLRKVLIPAVPDSFPTVERQFLMAGAKREVAKEAHVLMLAIGIRGTSKGAPPALVHLIV